MTNDNKIQQLVIDRNQDESSSNKNPLIILLFTIVICGGVYIWFNSSANAEMPLNAPLAASSENKSKHAPKLQAKTQQLTSQENSLIDNRLAKSTTQKPNTSQTAYQSVLDASGHIVARRVATVSSRVTGKLELLNIEEGIEVKKSDILAELDDKQARISYQLALAELAAQKASYQETVVRKKYALQKMDRQAQLAKEKLISKQLNEDSQLDAEKIDAQLKNNEALVDLAEQQAALVLYQLEQHKIRAPFDGVVISKNAQVGELISAGGNGGGTIRTGVGTIVDMSSLEIEVEVGESYINRVYKGQQTIASLDAYPQWKIKSEVIAVIPTADRQKASIKVRVKLHEIDHRILPDMGVKVSFLANEIIAKQ